MKTQQSKYVCSVCGQNGHSSRTHYKHINKNSRACSICRRFGHNSRTHKKYDYEKQNGKICRSCNVNKPIEEFLISKNLRIIGEEIGYRYPECRECANSRSKIKYRTNLQHRLNILLIAKKTESLKKNIKFDMNLNELLEIYNNQNGKCYYSNIEMSMETGDYAISVDKKDPSLGYIKENVVLTIWLVNKMKTSMNEREFLQMCFRILKHYKHKTSI